MAGFHASTVAIFFAILGFALAVPNQFAHYVSLRRAIGSTEYHHCSGVIVHPNWVLTASTGSCTARIKKIIAGDLNEEAVEGTEQTVVPETTVVKHATYPVALMKVTPGFQFNDNVNAAVFAFEDVIAEGNTVKTAGKNSATNGGYFQRILQETELTVAPSERCTFDPTPAGPGYSCLLGQGSKRCAGERGSPVQCAVGSNNFFCGLVINNGHCNKDSPNDQDPPSLIEQSAIHSDVIKRWISETISQK